MKQKGKLVASAKDTKSTKCQAKKSLKSKNSSKKQLTHASYFEVFDDDEDAVGYIPPELQLHLKSKPTSSFSAPENNLSSDDVHNEVSAGMFNYFDEEDDVLGDDDNNGLSDEDEKLSLVDRNKSKCDKHSSSKTSNMKATITCKPEMGRKRANLSTTDDLDDEENVSVDHDYSDCGESESNGSDVDEKDDYSIYIDNENDDRYANSKGSKKVNNKTHTKSINRSAFAQNNKTVNCRSNDNTKNKRKSDWLDEDEEEDEEDIDCTSYNNYSKRAKRGNNKNGCDRANTLTLAQLRKIHSKRK